MDKNESNKRAWRRLKDVDYICVEARPAVNADAKCVSVTLDWIPKGNSGACEAYQQLQKASMRCKTNEQAARFYAALREWAEGQ